MPGSWPLWQFAAVRRPALISTFGEVSAAPSRAGRSKDESWSGF